MAAEKSPTRGTGILRKRLFGLVGCAAAVIGMAASPRPAAAQYVGTVSSYVLDANTGQILQKYNADLRRYPASLTKLMTLYLAFQALRENRLSLDEAVPISEHAASMEPSKLGLVPGTYLTVQQAILALVTKSANDAACALGELMAAGDERRFGQLMTEQARLLGMSDTTFRNASGLPDPEQVSTARDFAVLTQHLIRDFPDQYHYFSVPAFMFHGRLISNHDPMLHFYPGADGLKTGYTVDAGLNLVSSAIRGNVRLIGVLLGARTRLQRSAMMSNILDAGFAAEGVPIPARPAAAPRTSSSMLLVADEGASHPIWHGRHHLHHARLHARLVGFHLSEARFWYGRGTTASHRLIGARLRRIMAHSHRWHRLRMASETPAASRLEG